MNINTTPITTVLAARDLELRSNVSVIGNVTTTFTEMQRLLLNGFKSSTQASSISVTEFLTLAGTSVGKIFDSQIKFIDSISGHLRETPKALVTVQSARSVGTTTALMLLAYKELLSNPHKTIVFAYPSNSMVRESARTFTSLVSTIQHDNQLPKIFTSKTPTSLTTPMGGKVIFTTSARGHNPSMLVVEHPNGFHGRDREDLGRFIEVGNDRGMDVIVSSNGRLCDFINDVSITLPIKRKWDENPNHDATWFNQMKQTMPSDIFEMEVNL